LTFISVCKNENAFTLDVNGARHSGDFKISQKVTSSDYFFRVK